MSQDVPKTMKAAVIDKFGGPEVLRVATIPVPDVDSNEILIRVDTAGVGEWDPWLREGGMGGAGFPMVLGSDGAGTVVAAGSRVKRFKVGDRAYGYVYGDSKGGFYAEYTALPDESAGVTPPRVKPDEAGALAVSAITGLIGLEKLKLKKGQSLMIIGASGGVGHVALQLAKRIGARTLAIASGPDGVDLVRRLGADASTDGRKGNVLAAVKDFAPEGLDAALVLGGADRLVDALMRVRRGGNIAYPNGVDPVPQGSAGVKVHAYDGLPNAGLYKRLDALISPAPFHVEISRMYSLEDVAQAHRDVEKHHVGKLALKIRR
jgi:NADPH2:quinone reductase